MLGRFGLPKLPPGALDAHQVPGRRRRQPRSGRRPASPTRSTRRAPCARTATRSRAPHLSRPTPQAGGLDRVIADRRLLLIGSSKTHTMGLRSGSSTPLVIRAFLRTKFIARCGLGPAWLGFCNTSGRAAVLKRPPPPESTSSAPETSRRSRSPAAPASLRAAAAAGAIPLGAPRPGASSARRAQRPTASRRTSSNGYGQYGDLSAPRRRTRSRPSRWAQSSSARRFATTGTSRSQPAPSSSARSRASSGAS